MLSLPIPPNDTTSCAPSLPRAQTALDRYYRETNLVSTYRAVKIFPAEAAAFIRCRDDIVNHRVLDLGCGAGRLAGYLLPLASRYVGVDVSRPMVDHCRRQYGAEFIQADIRELSRFDAGSFDTVLAVSNLIDAVTHAERIDFLKAVRRILVPGGLFFFSSHNLSHSHLGDEPQWNWRRTPWAQVREFLDYHEARKNRRNFRRYERLEPDYALLNDSGNNFASLHYYVRKVVQHAQLNAVGYEIDGTLDSNGYVLEADENDVAFPSLHYIARSMRSGAQN